MGVEFNEHSRELVVREYKHLEVLAALKQFNPNELILYDEGLTALDLSTWPSGNLQSVFLKTPALRSIINVHLQTHLGLLSAEGAALTDVPDIEQLTTLMYLNLSQCPIRSVEGLASSRSLRSLSIESIPARDLGPLGRLTNLSTLIISKTDAEDYGFLKRHLELVNFRAADVRVPGQAMPEGQCLENVQLSGWIGESCAFLRAMPNLVFLDLDRSHVTSYDGIGTLEGLEFLNLRGSSIADVHCLAACQSLEDLDLRNTLVEDLSPLEECPNLFRVRVTGKPRGIKPQGRVDLALQIADL